MQIFPKKTIILLLALLGCATFKAQVAASAEASWTTTALNWFSWGAQKAGETSVGQWGKNKMMAWFGSSWLTWAQNEMSKYFFGGSAVPALFSILLPFGLNLSTPWGAAISLGIPLVGSLFAYMGVWWARRSLMYRDQFQPNVFRFVAGHTINVLLLQKFPKWHVVVHVFAYFGYPITLRILHQKYNLDGKNEYIYLQYEFKLFVGTCLIALIPVLLLKFSNLKFRAESLWRKVYATDPQAQSLYPDADIPQQRAQETSQEPNYLLLCVFLLFLLFGLGYLQKKY